MKKMRTDITYRFVVACAALAVFAFMMPVSAATIVDNGKSEYVIVQGNNGAWDDFAADELRELIEKSTGLSLPVVSNDVFTAKRDTYKGKALYVGDCSLAREKFGDEKLENQEALVTEDGGFLGLFGGGDIWLRGGGNSGSSYAVYLFAEKELGYRMFTEEKGGEKIKKSPVLETSGRELRRRPHFPLQRMTHHMPMYGTNEAMFVFRNSGTLTKSAWTRHNKMRCRLDDDFPERDSGHGFFCYITCARTIAPNHFPQYPWKEKIDFFAKHPEWFSMNAKGRRTDRMQLCFTNPGLRKAFTERVLERCAQVGGRGTLTIGAQDVPGAFCHCPECKAANERQKSPGGAFFEYIPGLCAAVKERYPDIRISSLAYRKQQTEFPPADMLKRGVKMPDNWICDFAPVDDDQSKNLDAPVNAETLENIRKWKKLTPNITYWYYLCVNQVPVAPVTRIARDLKLMHESGVTGAGLCCYSTPSLGRFHMYLFFRLCIDPYQDGWEIAREFAEHQYGAAADDVLAYWRETDDIFMNQKGFVMLDQKAGAFHCYKPETVMRWHAMFDAAEKKVKGDAYRTRQLAIARWDLDSLTLNQWLKMKDAAEKASIKTGDILARMRKTEFPGWPRAWNNMKKNLDTMELVLKASEKPLPKELSALPADQVTQFPTVGGNYPRIDPAAVCGKAATEPFRKGEMTNAVKVLNWYSYGFNEKLYGGTGKLNVSKVKGGQYRCYYLGKGRIFPSSVLTFASWWGILQNIGELYPEGDAEREFEFWASLKFTGPSFGVPEKDGFDRVWCDRIFVVDKNGKKYKGKD